MGSNLLVAVPLIAGSYGFIEVRLAGEEFLSPSEDESLDMHQQQAFDFFSVNLSGHSKEPLVNSL